MSKFKVGDRVKCIKKYWRAPVGAIGTVKCITDDRQPQPYGIEWDTYVNGHTLNGRCDYGFGEWVNAENIELIKDDQQIFVTCENNKVISIIKRDVKEISRGIARCNPEDKFDFEYGANLATGRAFNKLKKLKVGDKVKVTNWGKVYSTYTEWFKESDNMDLAPYYLYEKRGTDVYPKDSVYVIKAIHPHNYNGHIIYAICQRGRLTNGIYLIDENGLERVE